MSDIAASGLYRVMNIKSVSPCRFGTPNRPDCRSPSEDAELGEIEDLIRCSFQEHAESLLVAIITTSGMREFVLYTRDPQRVTQRFQQLRNHIASHELQLIVQLDKTWGIYGQLS